MDKYKLKFENGRNCTIECDSTKSFQDSINDAETRFNSECIEINGKPIKKHSLGGFIVGATIGAILGNSVPAKTISKTASGVKRTAKSVTRKVKKQVKKFETGGQISGFTNDPIYTQGNISIQRIGGSAMWNFAVNKQNKGRILDAPTKEIAFKKAEMEIKKFSGGGVPKVYEVGIDEGDEGTHTIANFDSEAKAKKFMYDYQLKHPKAKLFIDSVTTDFLNSQKFSGGGSTTKEPYSKSSYSKSDWEKITAFLSKEYSQAETNQILNSRLMRMTGGDNYRSFVKFYNDYKKEFDKVSKEKFSGGGTTDDERYCRLAEDTGKGVNEGFVVGMGETIYESEDNLIKHLRELDYEDADGNSSKDIKSDEDLKEFFYNDEYYYWTEWDCDDEIEEQGYYYTRDGKEIEIASKGKKIKSKINKKYTHFAVNKATGKIRDGWETLSDVEELKYYANLDLKDNDLNPKDFNILSAQTLLRRGIDPYNSDNWQQIAYETGGSTEQMARGSKVKSKTNTQMIKALVKDLENTPYSIGLAILRERILTYSENDLRSLEKNPKNWENPIIGLGMYKDYYSRVNQELNFDSGKDNVKAIKGLVKNLENTPYSIGLVILRERLFAYAENDLKAMEKNPDNWTNPFISLGMYKDYANRVCEHLKFEYETGGLINKEDGSEIVGIESKADESSLDKSFVRPTRKDTSRDPEYISTVFNSGKGYLYNFFDKYGNKYEYDELVEKPKYETGGNIGSMAMAGASPQLAIADQVSQKLPETTSAIDRRIAERIYSEKPSFWEDRGMQYAGGGKVGDQITFKHWSGDTRTGTISEDLGNGNFDVSSGWGRVLVHKDDIISGGSKFSGGGSTPEPDYSFDYMDIGQFSVPDASWRKYSNAQFEDMGRKIVTEKYKGDLGRAYNEIVHKKFSEEALNEAKVFNEMTGNYMGGTKYLVNFHDGKKTHSDGSPFYDMRLFRLKEMKDKFIEQLKSEGYKQTYSGGGSTDDYVYMGTTMLNGLYEPVFKKDDKYYIKRYNPVRYDFLDDEKGIAGWRIHKMH